MSRPRTIGARLAATTAAVAVAAVVVVAAAAAVVIWRHEAGEERGAGDETTTDEVVHELALGLGVATPVVVTIAALATRRAARRITGRIDEVVAAATRMTGDDVAGRLPRGADDDELDRLAAALNALFDRIAVARAGQQQFVADAAHELRTPLAVLSTELEVARRQPRTPAAWEAVADRALAEVAEMTATVEALLRLARTQAVAPTREPVPLPALVDAAVARGARDAAVEVAPIDPTLVVMGDREALAIALGNVIANAVAHTRPGTAAAIAVTAAPGALTIDVDDHGPGVPPADRERIFQPFARGTRPADRAGRPGLGLGLSMTHRIIASHGGRVEVSDAPTGGARFRVHLPRPELPK